METADSSCPVSARVAITPQTATAGELGTWILTIELSKGQLKADDTLLIIPRQKAAKIWPESQFLDPWGENYTTASTGANATVSVVPSVKQNLKGAQKYTIGIRVVTGSVQTGESIRVTFGDRAQGSSGMRMLSTSHALHICVAFLEKPGGTISYLNESAVLSIEPSEPSRLVCVGPSTFRPGETIRIHTKMLDRFGNPCPLPAPPVFAAVPGTTVETQVALENAHVATLRVDHEPPFSEVRFHAREGTLDCQSNPMTSAGAQHIFWGDLHAHSSLAQGMESPEFLYEWARVTERLDFIAHVEHDAAGDIDLWVGDEYKEFSPEVRSIEQYIAATWKLRKELVRKFTEPGRFVAFLGFEWASNIYGHMNVIYRSGDEPIFYPQSFWQSEFDQDKLWERLNGIDAMTIPHHSGTVSNWKYASGTNWNYYNEHFLRNVEIYSKWGCSEYFGCPLQTVYQTPATCIDEGLRRGYQFGFVGGSDSHASRPGSDFVENGWDGIHSRSGLTAVYAEDLTRDALFRALRARRCYATTGARIIVEFQLNNHPMGSVLKASEHENRVLSFQVIGTSALQSVEIIKNGTAMFRYRPQAAGHTHVNLSVPDHAGVPQSSTYYYLRVAQEDGAMAWASPIWIVPE